MALLAGLHPVAEALRSERPIERIHIARGAGGPRIQELIDLARQAGIQVRFEERAALDRLARGASHQGVIAFAAEQRYYSIEDAAAARIVLVLDGVEDPHNLGAILRTANAAGVGVVVIPERRAASVTPVTAKAAAGAVEHLKLVRVTNVNRALDELKEAGFWVYGLDERGEETYDRVVYQPPTVIVVGGEGKGLHQQTRKRCDTVVRIPLTGKISSLNVSVATGIALFEWKRRASLPAGDG